MSTVTRWSNHIHVCIYTSSFLKVYHCRKFNVCCLLSCRNDSSTQFFCLCRPTVILHQGQGHRTSMSIYGIHKATLMRDKCPRYCKLKSSEVWDALVTLNEGLGHQTAMVISTFSRTTLTGNVMGIERTVSEIIKHLLFSWLRSVWPCLKAKVYK